MSGLDLFSSCIPCRLASPVYTHLAVVWQQWWVISMKGHFVRVFVLFFGGGKGGGGGGLVCTHFVASGNERPYTLAPPWYCVCFVKSCSCVKQKGHFVRVFVFVVLFCCAQTLLPPTMKGLIHYLPHYIVCLLCKKLLMCSRCSGLQGRMSTSLWGLHSVCRIQV